jgi:radical SAM superfamily enzyme YgiQ (UPF0313 family)
MTRYDAFLGENWAVLQQASLYHPEPNPTFANPDFEGASFRVLIVRLSPFRDVDRSTPHLFLFQAVRRALPDAYVDMAFFPPEHDRERLREAGVPLLVGVQSWRDVLDFDAVLVSNAYTLELINLPYLLIHSGLPALASERDAAVPPIVLGGSNALATQSVITPEGDCVADAIFFGEGEGQVGTLVRALVTRGAEPKRARLASAAQSVDGLWIANGPPDQRVRKAVCAHPQVEDLLTDFPVLDSDQATTARLQVSYGCPAFCSFCFEGYERKPYRELDVETLLDAARTLKRQQGAEALDLYSFNFNTHRDVLTLILDLNRIYDRVGLKSQRVDMLAAMPALLEAEVIADNRSFTLGIEGISRPMRAFLHKSLIEAEIENVLARLFDQKIREIKLFFILTGRETTADLAEFRDFVVNLKALRQQSGSGARIIFSVGMLVRMPFTPLQFDSLLLDPSAWRQVAGPVKSTVETNGFEFRMAVPWEDYAASQVLAVGGTWLSEPVLQLAREGHLYDLELTPGYWDALRAWLKDHDHWNEDLLGEKGPDHTFPLAFVDTGIDVDFLYRQYEMAKEGEDTGYCLGEVGMPGRVGETARCLGCGACPDDVTRRLILEHRMRHPGPGYLRELEAMMRRKWRLQPIYGRFWIPPVAGVHDTAWRDAFAMRGLLAFDPALVGNLLSVRERCFSAGDLESRYPPVYGETILAVKAWDLPALGMALASADPFFNGMRFLGWLDDYEPGTFDRARIRLTLPSEHFPEAGQRLRRFLQDAYVPVNLRRVNEGYRFDVPEKARKKRVLLAGHFEQDAASFTAELEVTPKFDLVAYLRSFRGRDRILEAQVEVIELEL